MTDAFRVPYLDLEKISLIFVNILVSSIIMSINMAQAFGFNAKQVAE